MAEEPPVPPFNVKDCSLVALATGKRALDLRELRDNIQFISPDSIYYHFWGTKMRPSFEDPDYHNDFATWAHRSLHDKTLAERLSMLDPTGYTTLEDLRRDLLEVIDERLDEIEQPTWVGRDRQFEFIRAQIVVFSTHIVVQHPREFAELMPTLSAGSVFYHFIDARRRNKGGVDDFENWLESWSAAAAAAPAGPPPFEDLRMRIRHIDPFFSSLTDLRAELAAAFRQHVRKSEHAHT